MSEYEIDVDEALKRAEPWGTPCGSCDYGMPVSCTCAQGDPRIVVAELINVINQLRATADDVR